MKITDVKAYLLSVAEESDDPYMVGLGPRSGCLIRITTDDGLNGLGETYAGFYAPEAARSLVEIYRTHLLGRDPLQIRGLWDELYARSTWWGRNSLPIFVLSGIEQALWDLAGKVAGMPVYQLLGGATKDKQRVYASCASSPWPVEKTVAMVQGQAEKGYNAVKFDLGYYPRQDYGSLEGFLEDERRKLETVRREVGHGVDLMIDAGQGFSASPWPAKKAIRIARALDEFNLAFFEEPCGYTNLEGYAEVRRSVQTPIAGGESLTTIHEWRPFLDTGCVDIAQPDASVVGGISECHRVITMAASAHIPVAMHCYGLGVAVAANLHVALANSNVIFLEYPARETSLRNELFQEPLRVEKGYVYPPSAPGLGVELLPETIDRYPFVPSTGWQEMFSIGTPE